MEICEICGCEFDRETAEYEFHEGINPSFQVDYAQFGRCLCGECAISEYENGNYFETCESCGKRFFPEDEAEDFESQVSHRITDADMYEHGIYCADCAAAALLAELDEECDDDQNDEDEPISVYDAALIWASNGKDE